MDNKSQDTIVAETTEAVKTQTNNKVIYSSTAEKERREFFGIDANTFKDQEFKLRNKSEVVRFNELLEEYVHDEINILFYAITLPSWFD